MATTTPVKRSRSSLCIRTNSDWMGKRRRKTPYKSGYCLYAPHQYPCKGQVTNGEKAKNRVLLCSCECHGDYEARLKALGLEPEEIAEDDEEDE